MSKRQTVEFYCDICSKVCPEIVLREITIPTLDQEDNPIQYTDGHICPACDVKLASYIKSLQQGTYEQKTDYESTRQQQQPPVYEPESLQKRVADTLRSILQYNKEQYPERGLHYACCNKDGHVCVQDTCNPETAGVWVTDQHVTPGLSLVVTDRPDLNTWLIEHADTIPEAFRYAAVDINGVACACVKPPVFTAGKGSWDQFPEDTYSIPGVWDARYPGAIYRLTSYRKGTPK